MFYHILVSDISDENLISNKTREYVLVNYVCPFINREVTIHRGEIYNMVFPIGMRIFKTDSAITTDWPIDARTHISENKIDISEDDPDVFQKMTIWLAQSSYRNEIIRSLENSGFEITEEIYREAVVFLERGEYRELRRRLIEEASEPYAFFICPFGNESVDHNYEFVIKPIINAHDFIIERADEITSSGPVTGIITKAIVRASIIIADLTSERPNCYYEVGFAHALGKPVIILAQEGTTRHFDISVHQWLYWKSYEDLKPKFERALEGIINEI